MSLKEGLGKKIFKFLDKSLFWVLGMKRQIDRVYADYYLGTMVERDLDILRSGIEECKFERDRNEDFQNTVKKYGEKYCPESFYRHFSLEHQFRYMELRIKIDDVLSRKDNFFSDTLGDRYEERD